LDEHKRKEFRNFLTLLDAEREQSRFRERERKIEKNRFAYRFEELTREVIVPALRELMLDLERKGHLARLTRKNRERLRLEIQIDPSARRCALEVGLHPSTPGMVKVDYLWGWRAGEPESCPLEEVTAGRVAEWMLKLLKGLA
jgi:hypothetical protein